MSAAVDDTTPRAYVACLSCFNDPGQIVGDWFDAINAESVTVAQIHALNAVTAPDHEELWCLDHENLPISGECAPMDATKWATVLNEVSPDERPALCKWVESGDYVTEADGVFPCISDFRDRYVGHFEDFRTFALDYAEEIGLLSDVPEYLCSYFDWDAWVADLESEHLVCIAGSYTNGVYIFRSC